MPKIRTSMRLYRIELYLAKRFQRAFDRGITAVKLADLYAAVQCLDYGPTVVTCHND
jgi:hypothetical protein